jgi:flagellar hook-length control protein FliK
MSPAAPQPISAAAPSGREPIPSGAPPGAPPEGPPFQSALDTEWARTATAEGQQQSPSQDPSPADGERAGAAEAFDRLPHGSSQPTRRHSGQHGAAMSAGPRASAGSAQSTATPTGSNPAPAAALPGSTSTDEPAPGATAGRGVNQAPAAHLPTQPAPATAPTGSLSSSDEDIPNSGAATARDGSSSASAEGALTGAMTTHDDAPPSSLTSPTDALAIPRDGTPTAGAPAVPKDGTPTASASPTPKDDTPSGNGIASALAAGLKDAPTAGESAQAHSAPAAAPTGGLALPHRASPPSASTGERDLAKTLNSSTPSVSTNADGVGGGVGGLGTTASALLGGALDGSPAAAPAELGSGAYGVGLQEAIESLHGTIQLAARQGLSQARISLQPEELGEIRINLTQTAQGLLARVTAESPAAAQALAAAHAQLRQSLSSLGINLTRLDIGHHDPSTQGGGTDSRGNGQGSAARGQGSFGSRPSRPTAIASPTDPETNPLAEEPTASTTAPSTGALIDVLV